jgi:DNA-binding transcriptional LysR family regulator
MRSIQFDWNKARAFLVTAEKGSFSAASRILNMTQPTLGRQVAALEKELGVTLFERTSTGLMLTSSGVDLLEHVRAMSEAANGFSMAASGHSQTEEGYVSLSATEATAAFLLPAMIAKLKKIAPGIIVDVIATNETSDLTRREADIAIRAYRPTQGDLIARKVCTHKAHLYAAPQYLQRLTKRNKPSDLNNADFLGFKLEYDFVPMLNDFNFNVEKVKHPVYSENHLVQWELVKQGLGIGFMTDMIGDAEPLVERVLPDHEGFDFDVWLVVHREVHTSRRIRLVYDFLVEELGES